MGITLAQLGEKMSSTEFELRMALAMVKQDECPNCGVEPRDLMEFHYGEIKCPTCHQMYGKVRRWGSSAVLREASAV